MAVIELIKKDKTPVFKEGEKAWGCAFYARKWSLEDGVFKCLVEYHIDDIDENTKKIKKDPITGKDKKKLHKDILEYLIEEELLLLNIDGARVFPIFEKEEEDDKF